MKSLHLNNAVALVEAASYRQRRQCCPGRRCLRQCCCKKRTPSAVRANALLRHEIAPSCPVRELQESKPCTCLLSSYWSCKFYGTDAEPQMSWHGF